MRNPIKSGTSLTSIQCDSASLQFIVFKASPHDDEDEVLKNSLTAGIEMGWTHWVNGPCGYKLITTIFLYC
jgi:hypothetical protein